MRTRMLAAGLAAIVAGSMTGCWTTQPGRPPIGGANSHIPRTNTNGFPPTNGAANGMNPNAINQPPVNNGAANTGAPVIRTTGMPANDGRAVNFTSGPTGSAP